MDARVGIKVDFGRYLATVHYLKCPYWSPLHAHTERTIPPSVKWKLCSHCQPRAEDIVIIASEIKWLRKYREAANSTFWKPYEPEGDMERLFVLRDLMGGKTLPKKGEEWD